MKNKFGKDAVFPILLAIASFILVSLIYFSPLLQGKVLSMHDVNMASGAGQELKDFHDKTGEWAWWTNSMFGGMPAYMITGGYEYSLVSNLGSFLYSLFPVPLNVFLYLMICFYIFARVIGIRNVVAIGSSIVYAFGTYNLVFVQAGHISKILALAFLPGILAGMKLIFDKKYFYGATLFTLFVSLEIYANHLQVTYYFLFIAFTYFLYHLYTLVKDKAIPHLIKSIALLALGTIIGVGMHSQRLWSAIEYSGETTRGKSELVQSNSGNVGLDKDYAFSWSYGVAESINLIVPNLMGGSTVGPLDDKSETYQVLVNNGVPQNGALQFIQALPLYHGDQSSTAGPAYIGITVFFFFLIGLFLRKDQWKWFHLGITAFLVILSWGSNFSAVNYWMFDHFPGYNKFRAVSMILILVHLLMVWGAGLGLEQTLILKSDKKRTLMAILWTAAIVIFVAFLGYFSIDLVGLRDQSLFENLKGSLGDNLANQVLASLRDDRSSLALSDIYRGIIFVALLCVVLWFYAQNKLSDVLAVPLLMVILVFDLFTVGKRYFNIDDFQPKFRAEKAFFEPTPADNTILNDDDPDFRVINLATPSGFMSDARDSYFHKSIGGYHGAKLKKYNELVENQMIVEGRLNMSVLNMLNTKYLINNTENGVQAQLNPGALGNAWFVDSLIAVSTADEELKLTGEINPLNKAVTQIKYSAESRFFEADSMATIRLTSYAPNRLVYESNAASAQFAVFSEIYYRGNKDWRSYIDGKETEHLKVNYVLRGMEIPAGRHEIVFEFKPDSVFIGRKIDLTMSIAFIALIAISIYAGRRAK